MERRYRHPDSGVERILEELAQQGGDLRLIDDFAKRAVERVAAKNREPSERRSAISFDVAAPSSLSSCMMGSGSLA